MDGRRHRPHPHPHLLIIFEASLLLSIPLDDQLVPTSSTPPTRRGRRQPEIPCPTLPLRGQARYEVALSLHRFIQKHLPSIRALLCGAWL
ncbi:hypothetical protein ZWY2020_029387 [Hordeum vulgare]|nr:hypothetical protein ZWY2020_029387 [Hordeum vulgare]